jgi:dipeptidyl aminopeptidase/acylaminoacyl peptidase
MKFATPVVVASIITLSVGTAGAFDHTAPLQLADVFELEYASDPQISPDGSRVVYVRSSMDIMTDRRRSQLWIVNTDGTDHRPLTSGNADYQTPMSESEQFYTALKLRKVDAALVRVPGASHHIAARPSQPIAKVAHILKWFEMYSP